MNGKLPKGNLQVQFASAKFTPASAMKNNQAE